MRGSRPNGSGPVFLNQPIPISLLEAPKPYEYPKTVDYPKTVNRSPEEAESRVRDALDDDGFGGAH